jgi:hypothetical protein
MNRNFKYKLKTCNIHIHITNSGRLCFPQLEHPSFPLRMHTVYSVPSWARLEHLLWLGYPTVLPNEFWRLFASKVESKLIFLNGSTSFSSKYYQKESDCYIQEPYSGFLAHPTKPGYQRGKLLPVREHNWDKIDVFLKLWMVHKLDCYIDLKVKSEDK